MHLHRYIPLALGTSSSKPIVTVGAPGYGGVVFKVSPSGTETVLHSFTGSGSLGETGDGGGAGLGGGFVRMMAAGDWCATGICPSAAS
jgi:hypothetical protein